MNVKEICDTTRELWDEDNSNSPLSFLSEVYKENDNKEIIQILRGSYDPLLRIMLEVLSDPKTTSADAYDSAKLWDKTINKKIDIEKENTIGKNSHSLLFFTNSDYESIRKICPSYTTMSNSSYKYKKIIKNQRVLLLGTDILSDIFTAEPKLSTDSTWKRFAQNYNKVTPSESGLFLQKDYNSKNINGNPFKEIRMPYYKTKLSNIGEAYVPFMYLLLNANFKNKTSLHNYIRSAIKEGNTQNQRKSNINKEDLIYAIMIRRAIIWDDVLAIYEDKNAK